jgi:hypothetical protein
VIGLSLFIAAVTWAAPVAPANPAVHPPSLYMKGKDKAVARAREKAWSLPLLERVAAVSQGFLNTPYVESPLGEGQGKDPDPLIRFDAVDCLTFVEQSLALALTPPAQSLLPTLNNLRYDGEPTYETRNHLMEAQWLPVNEEKGFIRDITRDFGGADTQVVTKTLCKETWAAAFSKKLAVPNTVRPFGNYVLNVIPLAKVPEHIRRVPSGTIAMVVRADRPGLPTRITHLGFIVHREGQVYLRHAAKSVFARVIDEELGRFLARNAKYDKFPVVGLSLYLPTDPSAPDLGLASGR